MHTLAALLFYDHATFRRGKSGKRTAGCSARSSSRSSSSPPCRERTPGEGDRRDFHLYIDEFQNFTTDSFRSILSEARKYRLCLALGHQYIFQLPEALRSAVFGNVGTMIALRVGYQDAEILAAIDDLQQDTAGVM